MKYEAKKLTWMMGAAGLSAVLAGGAHAAPDLQITEIYEGVSGEDITEDWFELTNFGTSAFTLGVDGDLYYDDASADPTEDEMVTGITSIAAGESVVVVTGNAASDATDFITAWGTSGVQVGYLIGDDPGGMSQGGETIFVFDGNTAGAGTVDSAAFAGNNSPGAAQGSTWVYNFGTGSWDGVTQATDGVWGAFTAPTAAGDFGEFPLIGSPGAVPEPTSLALLGLGGLLVARRRRG